MRSPEEETSLEVIALREEHRLLMAAVEEKEKVVAALRLQQAALEVAARAREVTAAKEKQDRGKEE